MNIVDIVIIELKKDSAEVNDFECLNSDRNDIISS